MSKKDNDVAFDRLVVSANKNDWDAINVNYFKGKQEVGAETTIKDRAAVSKGLGFIRRVGFELSKIVAARLENHSVKKVEVEITIDNGGNEKYRADKLCNALRDYLVWGRAAMSAKKVKDDKIVARCVRNY